MRGAEHEVVIAGAGPTGMVLAAELTLAGVDVAVVERRAEPVLAGSRAGGLHARTIELLDQRGVAERFLEAGEAMQVAGFALLPLDISDFPTRHPHGLALFQNEIERLLVAWLGELGVRVRRGTDVIGLSQDEDGVEAALGDGSSLRARWLAGCDGGRSVVRRAAGIGFPGWEAATSSLIAEVHVRDEPEWGVRRDEHGLHAIGPLDDGARARIVVREAGLGATAEPTLADLATAMQAVWGTDFGVHDPTWLSRFTDATRQAEAYRAGRVLLAGDAAHVHSPAGGQGLNLGVHDAMNLGWKLARVAHGTSPASMLDSYHDERHPAGARALRATMAMTALHRSDARTDALRETMAELLAMDEPRRHLAGLASGLDVHYDLGDGHPLLGRRVPDLDLVTPGGPTRVHALLRGARPALVDFGGDAPLDPAGRVPHVRAEPVARWELPVLGEVPAPTAVLVRPDGHVAWVGEGTADGLDDALGRWFGA